MRDFGAFVPIYNAACSGHGWVNYPHRDAAGEIPHTYLEAAAAFQPTIAIIMGSVNDLLAHIDVTQASENLKEDLDYLIDNAPELNHILLFQTFGWHQSGFSQIMENNDNGETWIQRYNDYNASLRNLDGYRGRVHYIEHNWKASPPAEYLIGSAPENNTLSKGIDYHPSTQGHIAMANIIYQSLKPLLNNDPLP